MLKIGEICDNIVKHMKNYMELALKEAKLAELEGEVPIGAVIVKGDEVIASGHNMMRQTHDPTAHAEIVTIRKASEIMKSGRLIGCRMYVTLEPCSMCVGAMVLARISEVIIGTEDFKTGACGSGIDLINESIFNHRIKVSHEENLAECGEILKRFFKARRQNGGNSR